MSYSIRWTQAGAIGGCVLLAALSLSACGGGGGGGGADSGVTTPIAAAPADTVPPSAGASTQAFVTFEQGLGASDTADPLELAGFLPPIDDHAEPFPVG